MAAPKKTDTKPANTDEPTSNQFHDELQNTSAANFSGGNTTAPVHNDVPQAPGFSKEAAAADE